VQRGARVDGDGRTGLAGGAGGCAAGGAEAGRSEAAGGVGGGSGGVGAGAGVPGGPVRVREGGRRRGHLDGRGHGRGHGQRQRLGRGHGQRQRLGRGPGGLPGGGRRHGVRVERGVLRVRGRGSGDVRGSEREPVALRGLLQPLPVRQRGGSVRRGVRDGPVRDVLLRRERRRDGRVRVLLPADGGPDGRGGLLRLPDGEGQRLRRGDGRERAVRRGPGALRGLPDGVPVLERGGAVRWRGVRDGGVRRELLRRLLRVPGARDGGVRRRGQRLRRDGRQRRVPALRRRGGRPVRGHRRRMSGRPGRGTVRGWDRVLRSDDGDHDRAGVAGVPREHLALGRDMRRVRQRLRRPGGRVGLFGPSGDRDLRHADRGGLRARGVRRRDGVRIRRGRVQRRRGGPGGGSVRRPG